MSALQWTDDDPGSVDLGILYSAMTDLSSAADLFQEARNSTTRIASALVNWSGEAADAWAESKTRLVNDLDDHEQRLRDARTAIASYRATCLTINNQASACRTMLAEAYRRLNQEAPHNVFGGSEQWKYAYGLWSGDQQQALADVSDATRMLMTLAEQRRDADRQLVSALQNALPTTWNETLAVLAAVGISSPADLTRAKIIEAMLEVSEGGGRFASDRDALLVLLDIYRDDESVMSQYFRELGGAGTAGLIDDIGDLLPEADADTAAELLALASRLRAGLSRGSAGWTTVQAKDFAAGLVSDATLASTEIDGNAAIAYLFSAPDTAPIGRTLTMQTAIAIDERERVAGVPLNNLLVATAPYCGGTALMFAEDPGLVERMPGGAESGYERYAPSAAYNFFYVDGAGEVFETLGRDTESAFAFIGTDPAASDRIAYWFGGGLRDSSGAGHDWTANGFEGLAQLWLGASEIDGGPVAGVYDARIGSTEATMTGRIIEALAGANGFGSGNPFFLSENLSPEGARMLATVVTLHLDGISQALQGSRDGMFSSNNGALLDFTDPITGESQEVANLSSDAFANLLGQIGGNVSGGTTLKVGVDVLSQAVFASAGADPALLPAALDRVVTLQGLVDGSASGAELGVAERSDEALRAEIDSAARAISGVLGFIPLPGGVGVSGIANIVENIVIDDWADMRYAEGRVYPDAVAHADLLKEQGERRLPSTLANLIYTQAGEALGLAAPPPWQAGSAAHDTWVSNTLDRIAEEYGAASGRIRDGYEQAFAAGSGESRG